MKAPLKHQNSLIGPGGKLTSNSTVNFKVSELNIISGSTGNNYDHKTFIKIIHEGKFLFW